MIMQGIFNANQFEPNQGMSSHPPCQKAPFTITDTAIVENKAKDGGMFVVHLTSPMGTQVHRYNIWNKEPKAVEIAHGQLSALCRAVNIYQIDWQNEGAALRGGKGLMDVGYQKGEEPTAEKPNGGYTELKKVYDAAGNEPGKAAQPQPAPQGQNTAPLTQQNGGGWGNSQPQGQATQHAPNQAGGAWQPGNAGNAAVSPPWGQR